MTVTLSVIFDSWIMIFFQALFRNSGLIHSCAWALWAMSLNCSKCLFSCRLLYTRIIDFRIDTFNISLCQKFWISFSCNILHNMIFFSPYLDSKWLSSLSRLSRNQRCVPVGTFIYNWRVPDHLTWPDLTWHAGYHRTCNRVAEQAQNIHRTLNVYVWQTPTDLNSIMRFLPIVLIQRCVTPCSFPDVVQPLNQHCFCSSYVRFVKGIMVRFLVLNFFLVTALFSKISCPWSRPWGCFTKSPQYVLTDRNHCQHFLISINVSVETIDIRKGPTWRLQVKPSMTIAGMKLKVSWADIFDLAMWSFLYRTILFVSFLSGISLLVTSLL